MEGKNFMRTVKFYEEMKIKQLI